jgi:Tol biopolymer transport system component/DNA-binding winged helix-turn-helix (wHTH) protein
MPDSVPLIYRFGAFALDPHKRLLLRLRDVIPLTPKAFDVLLLLVERRAREVSKDELMRTVWRDTVVEENSLARSVSAVRKALGEKAGEHRFIVTLPGRGYRFVAAVEEVFESDEERGEAGAAAAAGRGHRWRRPAVAAALAAGAAALLWALAQRAAAPGGHGARTLAGARLARLTSSGAVLRVAASPDGRRMAYVLRERGGQALWLADASGASALRLVPAASVEYWGLTFSADGGLLYYATFAPNLTNPVLHRIAARGGEEPAALWPVGSGVGPSPDGRELAYVDDSTRRGESRLMIAPADGGPPRVLALLRHPDRFVGFTAPAWAPDGRVIATVIGEGSELRARHIVALDARDGTRHRVGAHPWGKVESLAWRADGRALLVAGGEPGDPGSALWEVSYPEGRASPVTTDPSSYESVSAASQAGLVLAVKKDERASVWVAPSEHPEQARAILSATGPGSFVEGLAWAPGRRIVHRGAAGGGQHLWLMEADGGGRRQLTVDGRNNLHPAVCGGGRHVVFASDRDGTMHVWRMEAGGGAPVRLTAGDGEAFPACAADGRWVVYQNGYGPVKGTVWKVPLSGGTAVPLTDQMAIRPAVSPDERWIAYFYMDAEVWGLAVAPLAGGPPVRTLALPAGAARRFVRWTPDGRGLAYLVEADGVSNLWVQPLEGGPARRLTGYDTESLHAFGWSADGSLLASLRGVTSSDVVAVSPEGG